MASVTQGNRSHGVWNAFTEKTRQELAHDDQVAGRSICGILVAIVTAGLLLAVLSVLITA